MKLFGLGDIVARWIKAYPTVRVPRVHADEELSGTIPFHSGVPRGSVVDPLIFPLLVNGHPDALEALVLLFSDAKMVTRRAQKICHQDWKG